MHLLSALLLLTPLAQGCAPPTNAGQDAPTPAPRAYRLQAGDLFWIVARSGPDVSACIVAIPESGKVFFRPAGEVAATGKTIPEMLAGFQAPLKGWTVAVALFAQRWDPRLPREPGWVTIRGVVRQVEKLLLQKEMRLADALAEAGGLPVGPERSRVTVRHMDGSTEVVDLSAAGARGPLVRPGDVVDVPGR